MMGWGAVCEGTWTGGLWSQAKRMLHINCLELTAATLVVQAFAKDCSGISILLQLDNQTAVAYINHLGGTVSLQFVRLAKTLWLWVLQRDITLLVQHILGVTNQVADEESKTTTDHLDWKLSLEVFQKINAIWGPLEVNLFSSRLSSQLPWFFSWRPDPQAEATDAFLSEGLCQPSLVLSRKSSETGEGPTGSGDISGSSLERSAMVSRSPRDALGFSPVGSSVSGSVSHDLRDSSHELSASTSHVAYLQGKFSSQNLSSKARDLLLASWRTKSNKIYDSHFKKWLCWCSARGSDPISGPVSEVANFLAEFHEEGYQSSSLNVFRSAISSVHDKVDGDEVGKHPTITRLLKGAFHERPPLPRYTFTWDVNKVLQYLKSLGPSNGLNLKQLTHKLVMLLALTRPSRSAL